MSGISSLGVGSGLDIRSLVDQLVAAERKPVQNRLDRKEATYQAELSAFGSLKGALGDFRDKVQSLSEAKDFRVMKASSSNSDAVAVSASDTAEAGRYDIAVNRLAQSQSVASAAFADTTTSVGSGTLTFRFGDVTTDAGGNVSGFTQNGDREAVSVEIPADADSLQAVRDAVNDAETGVRASIINDGSGERLVFNAEDSGAANGFVVDVTDADGNDGDANGLSRLAFNTSAANLERARAGEDAELVVNGLTVTRPGNEITDLVDGVTFNLKDTTTTASTVNISQDVGAVRKKIEGFVESFNALQKNIDQLSGYDPESERAGPLQGNSTVRTLNSTLRGLVTDTLPALEGRSVRALTDLGITTALAGSLEIDSEKLDTALENNFEDVGALFGVTGIANGEGFRFESSRSATASGSYDVAVTGPATSARVQGGEVDYSGGGSFSEPELVVGSDNELSFEIDGVASGPISLNPGTYTDGNVIAADLQAKINGDDKLKAEGVSVSVAFENDRLVITSDSVGSESSVNITSVDTDTANTLGLSTSLEDNGEDIQGTINGRPAEGFGNYLTAQSGDAEGLKVEITGDGTGILGSVTFSRGITARLETALDSYLEFDGVLNSTTQSLSGRINDLADDRARLEQRLDRIEERYISQFSAMDTLVAQLNQTGSFLSSQLSGLEKLAQSSGGKDE